MLYGHKKIVGFYIFISLLSIFEQIGYEDLILNFASNFFEKCHLFDKFVLYIMRSLNFLFSIDLRGIHLNFCLGLWILKDEPDNLGQ